MTNQPRLDNIQALRAIAVFMVMAMHLMLNEARATPDKLISPWMTHGVAGVDLFFVISGFIMVYISQQRFGSSRASFAFILERAARIYPPAILFTALAVLGIFLAGTTAKWLPGNNILYSFLLFPQKQQPLLGVSWTLIHELYFYVIFSFFLLGKFRWIPVWLLIWAALVWGGQQAGLWLLNPWTKIIFHPLTFEFILGAVMGLIAVHFKPKWGLGFMLAGVAIMLANMSRLGLLSPDHFIYGWQRVGAYAPGASLIVYGAFALEASQQWRAPKWLSMIGNWSYSIYLSHLLILSTLAHLWMRFPLEGPLDNLIYIFGSIAVALGFGGLAFYGFERPVLRRIKSFIHKKPDRS